MKHTSLFIIQTVRSLSLLFALFLLSSGEELWAQNAVYGDQMRVVDGYRWWFPEGTTIEANPSPTFGNLNDIIKQSTFCYFNGSQEVTITIHRTASDKKPLSILVVQFTDNSYRSDITVKSEAGEQRFSLPFNSSDFVYLPLNKPITSNTIELTFHTTELSLLSIFSLPSIQHKAAKWHGMRENLTKEQKEPDTFQDGEEMFDLIGNGLESRQVQATHTMVDTIYMKPGSKVTLTLPNKYGTGDASQNSMNSYVRWYSYRTGKTYMTEQLTANPVYDLLTPNVQNSNIPPVRFDNGYVINPLTGTSLFEGMDFYFPTDDEFKEWFPSFANAGEDSKIDNKWYAVACDVSQYTDYGTDPDVSNKDKDGNKLNANKFKNSGYGEPTLTHRIIYYIKSVEEEKPPYEEYTINMPATRVRSYTNELVTLSKAARSYLAQSGGSGQLTATIEDGKTAEIYLTNERRFSDANTASRGISRHSFR